MHTTIPTVSTRTMLKSTIALFAGATLPGSTDAAQAPNSSKIIVTGGHPGDPEYGCGGTIARHTQTRNKVVLLYLNEGGPAEQVSTHPKGFRVAEAKKACEILNARAAFAGQIDGGAIVDRAHYEEFARLIGSEKPNAVGLDGWPNFCTG